MDLDLGGLALHATKGLVNHHLGIGQRETFALGPGRQQERAHTGRHARAQRRNIGLDEVHGVKNRQAGADRTARRVDVKRNVLVRILAFQEQQLCHHQVGRLVIDRPNQKDHPLLEQARVDVVRPLATARLLNDHGNQAQVLCIQCAHVFSSPTSTARTVPRNELGLVRQSTSPWKQQESEDSACCDRPGLLKTQPCWPISSSKETALSVTLALPRTKLVTLFSTTTASTSARRWRSPKYQRTTSSGFS